MNSSILRALGELLMDGDSTKSFERSKIGVARAISPAILLAAIMHAKRCRIIFFMPWGGNRIISSSHGDPFDRRAKIANPPEKS